MIYVQSWKNHGVYLQNSCGKPGSLFHISIHVHRKPWIFPQFDAKAVIYNCSATILEEKNTYWKGVTSATFSISSGGRTEETTSRPTIGPPGMWSMMCRNEILLISTVPPLLFRPQITRYPLYPDYKSYSLFFFSPDSNIMHVWVEYLHFS